MSSYGIATPMPICETSVCVGCEDDRLRCKWCDRMSCGRCMNEHPDETGHCEQCNSFKWTGYLAKSWNEGEKCVAFSV